MTNPDPYGPGGRWHKPPPVPGDASAQAGGDTPHPGSAPADGDGQNSSAEPRWQYEIEAEERAKRKADFWGRLRNVGGPIGFALLLIWKVGRIALVALGKVAILFKIPVLGTVLSGLVSIGAYAVFFGWSFAIGLVASLLVHELGHVVQIRREGMPIKALNFVPFLGAYVLSEAARSDDQQARISIAGPIAGTLLAVAFMLVANGDPLLEAIAYTGFFLNLFNLLPIPMLDGGGVGTVFTPGWWLLVAGALGLVALGSGVGFAVIAALAALLMAFLHRSAGFALDPGGIPVNERIKAAALYVAVIGVCAFGMEATFRDRTDDLVDQYGAAPIELVAAAQRITP